MRHQYLCFICWICTLAAAGQNLAPNGGFEELECPDNPINSIYRTSSWYATGADAYWLHALCPPDPVQAGSIVAIKPQLQAYRGQGYVSLEGALTRNGFFITEGIGIPLTRPLTGGRHYYFSMAAMNYELFVPPFNPAEDCDPIPDRFLGVWFSDSTITFRSEHIILGTATLHSEVGLLGELRMVDSTAAHADFRENRWYEYWNCFAASGNEKHIAVNGNLFKIPGPNNCVEEDQAGVIYLFGHAVDEIQLVEIPQSADTVLAMCPEGLDFDLQDLVSGPYFSKADFIWQDGYTGTERFFSSPGIYQVEMVLPCVSVPITLTVEQSPCKPNIFVPNAFSPNGDGVNDRLRPFVKTFVEIAHYRFRVYDRWGQLVFQTDLMEEGWDGLIRGRPAQSGIYTWSIAYELTDDPGKSTTESGGVLIIR